MRHYTHVAVVLLCGLGLSASDAVNGSSTDGDNTTLYMDVLMKGAKPSKPDSYLCAGHDVKEDEAYVVKFEANASADAVHHILLYGCGDGPGSPDDVWKCESICEGSQQIMFAWAKNAPPTKLPEGVGMRIGKQLSIKTVVVQIHYAKSFSENEEPDKSGIRLHLSKKKPQYVAGVYIMVATFDIPPNETKYNVNISCKHDENFSMFPFAYRTHAHNLGRVITGYEYNGTYNLIGKGNPMWPQAFYPTNTSVEVKPGDSLVARCTFNSVGLNHTVSVGSTGDDEMCNFYIMFYTNNTVDVPSGGCSGVDNASLVDNMPEDSDVPLPPNPLLEAEAQGHHHAMSSSDEDVAVGSQTEVPLSNPLEYQSGWPSEDLHLGQVGGVAADSDGNIYIFHRGDRIWNGSSFDGNNSFQFKDQPVQQETVIILSPDGHVIRKFGSGRFYMPHGIEVDQEKNIWVTDVALHQIFRIAPNGTLPNMELGVRFVSGDDDNHFCKPTDVAVLRSGEFFVSDGYCNSRILKFSKEGELQMKWGQENSGTPPGPSQFFIPHSLALAEDLHMVCVADRENGRIQCFDLDGKSPFILKEPEFGPAVYAVEYSPLEGGLLFAVNGGSSPVQGFTFSLPNKKLLRTWNLPSPQSLSTPHDVAVDTKGHSVYVGELGPSEVRKFVPQVINETASTIITTFSPPITTHTHTHTHRGKHTIISIIQLFIDVFVIRLFVFRIL
uniref:Peptidylglycine alpha-amidating monooxygenase n=1 Tax=Conus bullatus TaxID=89438 RepID=G8EWC9_CONBU|nr:peptidylglycine alpha-amidating monooxygenase [Conus bullatus]